MTRGKKLLFCSAALVFALAWSAGPAAAQTLRFVYAANFSSDDISAYTIDTTTGALTPIAGSPFSVATNGGHGPTQVSVDPTGRFALVSNYLSNSISVFKITRTPVPTGVLTEVAGSPFAAGGLGPISIQIDAFTKFLYVANSISNDVTGFVINTSTGALTPVPGNPYSAGLGPASITLDPGGQFVYATNFFDGTVSAWTLDAITGALTASLGSPFAAGASSASCPDSMQVVVGATQLFGYVANDCENTISAYAVNGSNGALTPLAGPLATAATGNSPGLLAVNGTSSSLYVTNYVDNNISGYSLDATTGALTPIAGSPFASGNGPVGVVVGLFDNFAYCTNSLDNNVTGYKRDTTTGALTPLAGTSTFAAGSYAYFVAVSR